MYFPCYLGVWSNPNTKIYDIVNYLLKMSTDNSRTWSIFLRQISTKYGLNDPLICLKKDPPEKSTYKEHILTKITAFYENELRLNSLSNSKTSPCNYKPAYNFWCPQEPTSPENVVSTYLTYEKRADQSGGSPRCQCCSTDLLEQSPHENLENILTECVAYSEVRERILPELESLCTKSRSRPDFDSIVKDRKKLCQFILDPTSLNLTSRISLNEPNLESFFRKSRDLCFSIHNRRMNILEKKKKLAVKYYHLIILL